MDVTTFYPLEGEDGLEACLEIAERPRHLVQRRYGLIVDRRSGRLVPAGGDAQADPGPVGAPLVGARPTARVVEYWDDEYFAYLVDGHLVRRGRHGYGAIPYVHAYGDQTPSRDPAKAGVSMLASMEYLVPLLDQLLTMKQKRPVPVRLPHAQDHQLLAHRSQPGQRRPSAGARLSAGPDPAALCRAKT